MFMSRRASLYLGASALAFLTGQAFGQAAGPPEPEGVPEQVIVTGSLLANANFAAPTPVQQVSEVEIETVAETGIGTVVGELPFAATGGGLVNQLNGIVAAAQSMPNLRGLGAGNTLVLINGMRPAPVNSANTYDLDNIPQSLLDRFEVVTTGASATYGSDAVAGAINFILKDHLEGFTGDARFGISQYGDEDQSFASLAWGTTLLDGRGHFEIGGEWANEFNTVNMYARPWGRLEPYLVPLTAATAQANGLPANIFTNHAEIDNSTLGGLITPGGCQNAKGATVNCPANLANLTFSSNGTASPFPFGAISGTTYTIGTGNYGVSSLNRQLSPPYERWAGLTRFEYDVMPNVTAFAMVDYGELLTNDPVAQTPAAPLNLRIYSGNPFIPASIQAAMTANGISSFTLAKEFLDGIGGTYSGSFAENKNITVQSFFGVKGLLFNDYNWDIQGSAGRSNVWQAFSAVPVSVNLDAAADVITGPNGTPVCNTLANNRLPYLNPGNTVANAAQVAAQASPNCVPYNPFAPAAAAMMNYINNIPGGPDGVENNIRQYMIQADFSGPVFNLPAGPLVAAIGANYRYNSFDQRATQDGAEMLYATRNIGSFYESQSVHEAYGELGIPLLRDLPFVSALDANAAGRYTDYSITGGVYTWKYGGTWDVFDWLRLRATRSQDIRAPNFTELSIVPASSSTTLQNPIDGVTLRVSNIETSGSPLLHPEVSQNKTFGMVVQPPAGVNPILSGFRASVDYYYIRIAGLIASDSAQDVLDKCLLQQIQLYCNQVVFLPGFTSTSFTPTSTAFGIKTFNLVDLNLNSEVQDGIDFNISQRLPLDGTGVPGAFQISLLASYINQQTTYQTTIGPNGTPVTTRINNADTATAPRWSGNFNFTYFVDRFRGNLQLRYYSPIIYSELNVGPNSVNYAAALKAGSLTTINRNLWPGVTQWNLALSYDLIQEPSGQDLQVYLNIDNLLNKSPAIVWSFISNYDVVGRYFKAGVRYTLP